MKIGLSYDQGSQKYRLYAGALMAAAKQAGIDVQPLWIAGTGRETDRTLMRTMDGLLLTGGADVEGRRYGAHANRAVRSLAGRDDLEWEILDAAFARRLPILAICRGMQLLNVYRGGTLIPDLPNGSTHTLDDSERHTIVCEPGSALAVLTGELAGDVTSSHHQAVAVLGRGLTAAAHHADGTIEAIEWKNPLRKAWLAAVQWHPERMGLDEPFAGALFRGFLQAVAVTHVA